MSVQQVKQINVHVHLVIQVIHAIKLLIIVIHVYISKKLFSTLLNIFFILVIDVCNGSMTNRVCLLAPTNRDTYKNVTGYTCVCKTGYQQVGTNIVCQGMIFSIKDIYDIYLVNFHRY
jgi:hypothetical protein